LPFAIEMEQAVLGILLLESEKADNYRKVARLTPSMFGDQRHKYIFNTIRKLSSQGSSYNVLLVNNAMRDDGMADKELTNYMTELMSKVTNSSNIESFAFIIEQKWMAREMIADFESRAAALRKNADPLDMLDKAKMKMMDITPKAGRRLVSAQDMWPDISANLQRNVDRLKSGNPLAGVTSGFRSVDNLTLGWMPKEYYLFGGRPAMGKTAFALALTMAAGMAGHPVHFTSLEMGAEALIRRMIAYKTELVSTWRMRKGDLSIEDFKMMNNAADRVLKNIYIEDGAARDIDGIYNSCYEFYLNQKQETDKHPVYFLDYAQLTDASSPSAKGMMNREQVLSSVSRGWKAICKDMNAPGIALSQLSRAVETRGDKIPQMSDLRESGSLEQDADFIGFLYRPEYYGIETYEDGKSTKDTGQLLVRKYREGEVGDCLLGFTGSRGWYNYDEDDVRFPTIRPNLNYSAPLHSDEQPVGKKREDDPF